VRAGPRLIAEPAGNWAIAAGWRRSCRSRRCVSRSRSRPGPRRSPRAGDVGGQGAQQAFAVPRRWWVSACRSRGRSVTRACRSAPGGQRPVPFRRRRRGCARRGAGRPRSLGQEDGGVGNPGVDRRARTRPGPPCVRPVRPAPAAAAVAFVAPGQGPWAAYSLKNVTLRRLTRSGCPGQDWSARSATSPCTRTAGLRDFIARLCARRLPLSLSADPTAACCPFRWERKRYGDVQNDDVDRLCHGQGRHPRPFAPTAFTAMSISDIQTATAWPSVRNAGMTEARSARRKEIVEGPVNAAGRDAATAIPRGCGGAELIE
jgi:hypothetical protein